MFLPMQDRWPEPNYALSATLLISWNSVTYREERPFHEFSMLFIFREPPLRVPFIAILAKYTCVSMRNPSVDTNNRATLKAFPAVLCACFRHNTLKLEAKGRMDTPGFLDASVEIGQIIMCLSPAHRVGEIAI